MYNTDIESCTVYFTSLCNSGCQTCDIWKNKEREEFPFETFKDVVLDPVMRNATYTLIGGEFTVYSKYIDVVKFLNDVGAEYYFITNGILPERIKKVYERTGITNLSLSLDAYGTKHDELRGAPNNFKKIIEIIEWVEKHHPETNLRIGYTISPYNSREDLKNVQAFCLAFGIDLKLSIGSNSEVLMTHSDTPQMSEKELYKFEDLVEPDQYLELYRAWARGKDIKCNGIFKHVTLNYNQDILLCENRLVTIGNLKNSSMSLEWNSNALQRDLRFNRDTCNKCWMSCVRKADAKRISPELTREWRKELNY